MRNWVTKFFEKKVQNWTKKGAKSETSPEDQVLFLVFLEIGNNEVTDLHAHFFLLNPNHLLVAHQQLGFGVLQFSLKVHHLLLGISQVHFGITQDKIMC